MCRSEISLNAEFGTKFQREVPLFREIPEFPYNTGAVSAQNCNNRFTALCLEYPGEQVPEETLTHPPSWSSSNLYHLLPSTAIHSILPVQIKCLAVFLHNLPPCPLWSTSWSGALALHLIFHTFLHPISVFFSQHMPIPSQPVFAVVSALYHLFLGLKTGALEIAASHMGQKIGRSWPARPNSFRHWWCGARPVVTFPSKEYCQYSFPIPLRVGGWVVLGGWLHTNMVYPWMVLISVLITLDVK